MNEIVQIELYVRQRRCAILEPEEALGIYPETERCYAMQAWEDACGYLNDLTDDEGICRLELDKAMDGNTLDAGKNTAIFMILSILMKKDMLHCLPPEAVSRGMMYVQARMGLAAARVAISQRREDFVKRTAHIFSDPAAYYCDPDALLEHILQNAPPARNFANLSAEDRERYRPLFEILYERTRACADPGYAETIEAYLDLLREE